MNKKSPLTKAPDWHIIAQRGLLALNLNMQDKAWSLWISSMQHTNKDIAPLAIGMVLNDYLQRKQWQKAESLIKRCLRFNIIPQTADKQKMSLKKIYIDVMDKLIKAYLKTNNLTAAKSKKHRIFQTFSTRQPPTRKPVASR